MTTAPEAFPPLSAHHPAVRGALCCPCCKGPFVEGAVTCLWPDPEADGGYFVRTESGHRPARLLHFDCAVNLAADAKVQRAIEAKRRAQADDAALSVADRLIVHRERLRIAHANDADLCLHDSADTDGPEPHVEELREMVSLYSHEAAHWRDHARRLEAGLPSSRPAGYNFPADAARLDFLERRIREHGPDLGYLLGLPQGWTNLRAAVDQALQAQTR